MITLQTVIDSALTSAKVVIENPEVVSLDDNRFMIQALNEYKFIKLDKIDINELVKSKLPILSMVDYETETLVESQGEGIVSSVDIPLQDRTHRIHEMFTLLTDIDVPYADIDFYGGEDSVVMDFRKSVWLTGKLILN